MRFKTFLIEKIQKDEIKVAEVVLTKLKKLGLVRLPSSKVGEVTKRDGSDNKNIMIRVKPEDEKEEINKKELMAKIEKMLGTIKDAKSIKSYEKSPNSSKFPSVGFKLNGRPYDIVIANGSNAGEKYENALLAGLISHHLEGITDEYLEELEIQMEELDPTFHSAEVKHIKQREGGTRRSGVEPGEIGPIIADIVFVMNDDSKRYISLKNKQGDTFANLGGVRQSLDNDFKLNKNSEIGKILMDIGFDADKIQEGFKANKTGKKVKFPVRQKLEKHVGIDSALYQFLLKSWGWNYFYVRELSPGFKVRLITEKLVRNTLLKDLTVHEIFYPNDGSKQIKVIFGNDLVEYYLEIRNVRGDIKPTDAKVKIVKMKF